MAVNGIENGVRLARRLGIDVGFGCDLLRSKYGSVRVYILHITPADAVLYLHRNTNNRPIVETHVRAMRNILEAGDMVLNGEAIIIGVDGRLLNGQHRLTACVESGIGFDALVVEGIDPEAFRTLDGGKKRSAGDVFAIDGERHANKLAAAIQALVSFVDSGGCHMAGGYGVRKATPQLAARIIGIHPGLRDSVDAMASSKHYVNQHGFILHYLFSIVSPELADDFATILANGHEDLSRPFVVFREGLIVTRTYTHLRSTNAAKAIKAFNAERSGHRPKLLRLLSTEDFPLIDGLDYEALFASVK